MGEFHDSRAIGPAVWECFDLFYVHEGEVLVRVNDLEDVVVESKGVLLLYPDTLFRGYTVAEVSKVSVCHFVVEYGAAGEPFGRLAGKVCGYELYAGSRGVLIEDYVRRSLELAYQEQSGLVVEMRRALLTLMVGELERGRHVEALETRRGGLGDLLEWLGRHLGDKIGPDDMAELMGYSVSHFRALFRRELGISPYQYLMEMRMERAGRLLRETSRAIKEVGRTVGYGEAAHFYRAFRRYYGCTPGGYREKYAVVG